MPDSGFFLDEDRGPKYGSNMRNVYDFQQSSATGLNADCVAAHQKTGDANKCSEETLRHAHAHAHACVYTVCTMCTRTQPSAALHRLTWESTFRVCCHATAAAGPRGQI